MADFVFVPMKILPSMVHNDREELIQHILYFICNSFGSKMPEGKHCWDCGDEDTDGYAECMQCTLEGGVYFCLLCLDEYGLVNRIHDCQ